MKVGEKGLKELEVKAGAEKSYFVERAGFNPMSLLQNPMILIAGVSMLVVFGMPYLMDNSMLSLPLVIVANKSSGPRAQGRV